MENNVIEDKKESKEIIKIHRDTLEVMEREIILSYLNECKWNKQIVADKLGICISTLWRKLKESK
ncbi:helix-turn-helix domain-containing protein [Clostridioides sp. GD02376]|uniref:helix-turn-helix domain-containing protein n=1 Tax=Clostridioides sp. GD02376 TaxID=3054352 RepID=UPI00389EB3F0